MQISKAFTARKREGEGDRRATRRFSQV